MVVSGLFFREINMLDKSWPILCIIWPPGTFRLILGIVMIWKLTSFYQPSLRYDVKKWQSFITTLNINLLPFTQINMKNLNIKSLQHPKRQKNEDGRRELNDKIVGWYKIPGTNGIGDTTLGVLSYISFSQSQSHTESNGEGKPSKILTMKVNYYCQ